MATPTTDIFGIDEQITHSGVVAEYKTSAEIRIRFVIENAQAGNQFSVYGKIKGQTSWNIITTLAGNAISDVTVAQFDSILVVTDTYSSLSNFVHLLASGIAQSSTGVSSITAGGNTLVGFDNISFTSADTSLAITSNASTGIIDFSVSSLASVTDLITLSGVPALSTDLGTFTGTTIPDAATVKSALQSLETSDETVKATVGHLNTLSGVSVNADNLGTFTGAIIPANSTNKAALQSLATAITNLPDPMEYRGLWSAATNTPTLSNGTGHNGDVYQVTAGGSVNFGAGSITFSAGDKVVYDGAISQWEKWNMTNAVSSVNGQVGVVTLVKADVGLGNVDNTSDANKPVSTAQQTALNLKENLANKATDLTSPDNTKYPSTLAVSTALTAKQDTGNYITALTGEVTASGPGSTAATVANSAVIGKVLTGYASTTGTILASDSILVAIEKLNGNTPVNIDDLADVIITTPLVNDRLTYNGLDWVNSPVSAIAASRGVILFPDDTATVDSYGGMPASPTITSGTTDSVIVPAGTTVFSKGYLYNQTLNNTLLPGGEWAFDFYCETSNASGTSQLGFDVHRVITEPGTVTMTGSGTTRTVTATNAIFVSGDANANQRLASYVQTSTGTFQITAFTSSTVVSISTSSGYVNQSAVSYTKHALLFGTTSANIGSTSTILVTTLSVQPSFVVAASDKLGLRVYGIASATRTISFHINGTSTYSHITTTLAATHNDLAGLQGGNTTERYHLSAAEATVATQAATTSLNGYLTSTDWNTFNNKVTVISGDIAPTSFSAANNQSSAANVTGLSFASGVTRSFQALVSVTLIATTNAYETFCILGIQKNGSFDISIEGLGDNSGVVFSITSAGQIQYTSIASVGFVSNTIKFRAININI